MRYKKLTKKRIGELLIERELLTEEQLDRALGQQKEQGGYISQHLISLGYIQEIHVVECLVTQYGFPYLPLEGYHITDELFMSIPFKFIDIYSFIPLEKNLNTLTVAMADPLNEGVLDMLKQITKCEIRPCVSTYSEIRQVIESNYAIQIERHKNADENKTEEIKKELLSSFVQTKRFDPENERRKHVRIELDLAMTFYLDEKECRAQIKNISYGGMLFYTDVFIPLEKTIYANIVCKLDLKDIPIHTVLQVLRVEEIPVTTPNATEKKAYTVAGFYSFMAKDDKDAFAKFLVEKITGNVE